MPDTLLNSRQQSQIISAIRKSDYKKVITVLDSVSTSHAGTAKMKDKRFVIKEIVKHINSMSDKNKSKSFFSAGKKILSDKSDNAKEIGIHILWRGYKYNIKSVEEYLLKIADDVNWEVREYAAGVFGAVLYTHKEFYKTLLRWSKHKSENIRRAVVLAVPAMIEKDSNKNLTRIFSLLEPLLHDSSVYVKKNLGPFILGGYVFRKYPKETMKQLQKWLKLKDENVRWNLAKAFHNSSGNNYPNEALKILSKLKDDGRVSVQRAVKSTRSFLSKRHPRLFI